MTTDGIVDYTGGGTLAANLENGGGDRGQNYSWGSIGYGDSMYIGTCYGAWTSTLQFMKASLTGLEIRTITAAAPSALRRKGCM